MGLWSALCGTPLGMQDPTPGSATTMVARSLSPNVSTFVSEARKLNDGCASCGLSLGLGLVVCAHSGSPHAPRGPCVIGVMGATPWSLGPYLSYAENPDRTCASEQERGCCVLSCHLPEVARGKQGTFVVVEHRPLLTDL